MRIRQKAVPFSGKYKNPITHDIPDICILPEIFFDSNASKKFKEGERNLAAAILEEAVNQYIKALSVKNQNSELQAELREWFFAEDENDVFSFENICEYIGYNSDYLKNGLRKLTSADLVKMDLSQQMRIRNSYR